MRTGIDQLRAIVNTKSGKPFVLLNLGFEDRCLRIPEILHDLGAHKSGTRILCAEHADDNVTPLAAKHRETLKKQIKAIIDPEFVEVQEARNRLSGVLEENSGAPVVLDASSMPRAEYYDCLRIIGGQRKRFERVFVAYTHPRIYISGDAEIMAPDIRPIFEDTNWSSCRKRHLVLYGGFGASETATVLSAMSSLGTIRTSFVFCFPGAELFFYERARCAHRVFFEYLDPKPNEFRCWMREATSVASPMLDISISIKQDEMLVAVVLGPRIVATHAFLTVYALRQLQINTGKYRPTILKTRPLAYRSVRSKGARDDPDVIGLNAAFRAIEERAKTILPLDSPITLFNK